MRKFDFDAVIFDLDGTLIDSMYVWSQVDINFLNKRGFDVPEDYGQAIAPLTFRETAEYTIKRFNLNEDPDDIMDEWNSMALYEYSEKVKLKPGAADLLAKLKEKEIKMAVCTSNVPQLFVPCLTNNGVIDYFESFTTTDEVGASKRKPQPFTAAAEKLGVPVSRCLVLEDVPGSAEGAKLGGFTVWGIFDDKKHEAEMKSLCDDFIYDYKELISIL